LIRIPQEELHAATLALMACAEEAKDLQGHRVVFELGRRQALAAVLGALTAAYGGGPVTPEWEFYYSDITSEPWPPRVTA
jgi:hypothetical protein